MDSDLKNIIKAAESGGKVLKKYFGQSLEMTEKSIPSDFYTKADIESEAAILKIISKEFPSYNIFSEEKGSIDKKSEYTFIIDPLDGTNNFVVGIPDFSIPIALMKNDEVILSVIHNPITNQTYYSQKRRGVFLDGQKLQVNKETDIKRATVIYTAGYSYSREYESNILKKLNDKNIKRILMNWSPAFGYCLLAAGKLEAIINNDCEIYDYVAGKLIAREAGALITDFKGNPEKSDKNSIFLATNGTKIHQELLEILY